VSGVDQTRATRSCTVTVVEYRAAQRGRARSRYSHVPASSSSRWRMTTCFMSRHNAAQLGCLSTIRDEKELDPARSLSSSTEQPSEGVRGRGTVTCVRLVRPLGCGISTRKRRKRLHRSKDPQGRVGPKRIRSVPSSRGTVTCVRLVRPLELLGNASCCPLGRPELTLDTHRARPRWAARYSTTVTVQDRVARV
jgi:hypothetical protein